MTTKIVNLTPHAINFINESKVMTIESSGVARARQIKDLVKEIKVDEMMLPVYHNIYGEIEGLPEPEEGVLYLVSALAAQAVPERTDVYITDDAVRDADGRIIGCRGIAHI